jgi:ubiquinone/menaquinone biosynthesis C-methylase UbiE
MDDVTKDNQQKWDRLVQMDVPCSRSVKDIDPAKAREKVDPYNMLGDVKGKKVLCLASGGGQQSIEFALLGADVTVVDFSQEQLQKDQQAMEQHSLSVRIVQSDMRDLSMFETGEFDIVFHPYSINYIPEVETVFDEVTRVLKSGGIYYLMFHNPFVQGSWKDSCWGSKWDKEELWQGRGYPLSLPYKEGYPIKVSDQSWNFVDSQGTEVKADAPQEFKHTLSTIINSLIQRNFTVLKFQEITNDQYDAEPGSWEHYMSVAAPWFQLWTKKD